MTVLERLAKLRAIESDLGSVDFTDEIKTERLSLEDYYWEWVPHEIGLSELKELDPVLYQELREIKKYLKIA